MIKEQYILDKISQLFSVEGKKMVAVIVEPKRDTERQFEKYTVAYETVKTIFEAEVATS